MLQEILLFLTRTRNKGEFFMARAMYLKLPVVGMVMVMAFSISCSYAGTGSDSGSFLRINPTARSSALGNTYTGLSDDLESLVMNPGGLYQLKCPQLSLLHMIYMEGVNLEYAAFGMPLPNNSGVVAFRIEYLTSGDIPRSLEINNGTDYTLSGSFNVSELLAGVSYSTNVSGLGIGINANLLMETLDTVSGTGLSFDVGVHYPLSKEVKAGLSAQNIGLGFLKLGNGNYPLLFRGGVVVNQKIESYDVLFLADAIYDTEASKLRGGLGVEGNVLGMVLLRLGYELGYDLGGFTAGIGFGFNAMGERLELNYAMVPRGDFGLTHKFSLTAKFGEKQAPAEINKAEADRAPVAPVKTVPPVSKDTVPAPAVVPPAEKVKAAQPENTVLKEAKPDVTAEQPAPKKIRRIIKKKRAADGSTTSTTIYPDGQPVQDGEKDK